MRSGVVLGALVMIASIVQVSVFAPAGIAGGGVDVLLVTLVCVALVRGSVAGAVAGFAGGLLVDTATLGTLGVTALLLTVAGYWAGRYGETTGRGRAYAAPLTVAVITVLVAFAGLGVHYMLGESVSANRTVAILLPAIGLNLLATWPVNRLCRAVLRPHETTPPSAEVQILV
jgi:rod shape-determining protein MreD